MKNFVVTEISLVARLQRSGLLKYFSNDELKFYITDFCYDVTRKATLVDRICAQKLVSQNILAVQELNDVQMNNVEYLHAIYKPKFIIKTISALVLAKEANLKLISEDDLLREVASRDLNIKVLDKESLITDLVYEINMMGTSIDLDLVMEVI